MENLAQRKSFLWSFIVVIFSVFASILALTLLFAIVTLLLNDSQGNSTFLDSLKLAFSGDTLPPEGSPFIFLLHGSYLLLGIVATVASIQTLSKYGEVFAMKLFPGRPEHGRSSLQLTSIGFYLIMLGFLILGVRMGAKPIAAIPYFEVLGFKLGIYLFLLAAFHYARSINLMKLGRRP